MQGAYESPTFQPSFEYAGTTGSVVGSDTSRSNADWRDGIAYTVQGRILSCIAQAGFDGCTSKEIEDALQMSHQRVSSSIRNMELDGWEEHKMFSAYNCGKVVKLKLTRGGQHAYVTRQTARMMMHKDLQEPNARRVSYKHRYEGMRKEIFGLLEEMSNDYSWTWYEKLNKIYQEKQ